ncbi:unnamed protein product [Lactuca saligna]|uniref:C3HC-type domain-containing protein n=1 Tax=Lactuca saligna TaxID=75948 RepID=A0AA35YEH0_LACSI|nr:unnamed protein product [Lactuca saligna]
MPIDSKSYPQVCPRNRKTFDISHYSSVIRLLVLPPPFPGASSPVVATNAGSTDWLGHGQDIREEFANQLNEGHKVIYPWRGNSCVESLVQFPSTPPLALIRGHKDHCDGLFKFLYLLIVASSTLDQMKVSRGVEID